MSKSKSNKNPNKSQDTWGLQKLWDYHLQKADNFLLDESNIYLLVVSLSNPRKRLGKNNAETYKVNQGYVTNAKYGSFLSSLNTLVLKLNENKKLEMIRIETPKDIFGIDVPEYQGLNLAFELSLNEYMFELMGFEYGWSDFTEQLGKNKFNQLQVLVNNETNEVPKLPKPSLEYGVVNYRIKASQVENVALVSAINNPMFISKIEEKRYKQRVFTGTKVDFESTKSKPVVEFDANPSWRTSTDLVASNKSNLMSNLSTAYNDKPPVKSTDNESLDDFWQL